MVKAVKNSETLFLSFFLFIFLVPLVSAAPLSEETGSITINPLTGNVILPGNVTYPLGTACTQNVQCNSGYCVDGYCCNSACAGSCDECDVSGSEGTCTDVNSLCSNTASSCYCSGGSCVICPSRWSCTSYTCYSPGGGGGGGGTSAEITPKPISAGGTGVFGYTDPTLSIVNVSVTVNRTVTYAKVNVAKSTMQPASFAIGAPGIVYQYLTITKTNINDSDITNVKIVFKVEKSWITANNIDSSSIKMYRYVDGSWVAQPTTKIGEDSTYIYFEATSTGLSYFVISATKKTGLTFWQVVTYIDNYYAGQITFWTLLDYISNYYSG